MFANKRFQLNKLFFLAIFLCFVCLENSYSQVPKDSVPDISIASILNSGEIKQLAQLLNTKVDIILPGQSGIYSNTQAFYILQDFFTKNKPTSFQIVNETANNGSNFVVGKMYTTNKKYRICYLTKYSNDKLFIYQLSIEE